MGFHGVSGSKRIVISLRESGPGVTYILKVTKTYVVLRILVQKLMGRLIMYKMVIECVILASVIRHKMARVSG